MKKIVKMAALAISIIILLLVLAGIVLITFVSPNRFKPLIVTQINQAIGREIKIDGDLSWSFLPHFGVQAEKISISNSPPFSANLATMDKIVVNVRLWPLMSGKFESSGIFLKGAKIVLIKNKQGVTNWQRVPDVNQNKNSPAAASATTTTPTSAFKVDISEVSISDAEMDWRNEQTNQHVSLSQLNLKIKNLSQDKPLDLSADFHMTSNNPAVSGDISLETKAAPHATAGSYQLSNLTITANLVHQNQKLVIHFSSDVAMNTQSSQLQFDKIKGQIANLAFSGTAKFHVQQSQGYLDGQLHIAPFDAKKWLQSMGQDIATVEGLKNVSGYINFSSGPALSSAVIQGNLLIDEMRIAKIRTSSIKTTVSVKQGILSLAPFSAAFYQGTLQGNAKIDLNNQVPQFALKTTITNVDTKSLLSDVAGNSKLKFSGKGNANVQITTKGKTADTLMRNLNGSGNISVNNGSLEGVDIAFLLNSAQAIANRQVPNVSNSGQTKFGLLTASFNINQGVLSNNNLAVNTGISKSTGKGTINLVNQSINYELMTSLNSPAEQKNNIFNLYGITVPILITGKLSDPRIQVDTASLMQQIGKQQLKNVQEKAQDQIQKKINKVIPGGGNVGNILNNFLGK